MLGMAGKATSHTSRLVTFEPSDITADEPDTRARSKMADVVESLDTRELDLEEGEETDFDAAHHIGVCVYSILPLDR